VWDELLSSIARARDASKGASIHKEACSRLVELMCQAEKCDALVARTMQEEEQSQGGVQESGLVGTMHGFLATVSNCERLVTRCRGEEGGRAVEEAVEVANGMESGGREKEERVRQEEVQEEGMLEMAVALPDAASALAPFGDGWLYQLVQGVSMEGSFERATNELRAQIEDLLCVLRVRVIERAKAQRAASHEGTPAAAEGCVVGGEGAWEEEVFELPAVRVARSKLRAGIIMQHEYDSIVVSLRSGSMGGTSSPSTAPSSPSRKAAWGNGRSERGAKGRASNTGTRNTGTSISQTKQLRRGGKKQGVGVTRSGTAGAGTGGSNIWAAQSQTSKHRKGSRAANQGATKAASQGATKVATKAGARFSAINRSVSTRPAAGGSPNQQATGRQTRAVGTVDGRSTESSRSTADGSCTRGMFPASASLQRPHTMASLTDTRSRWAGESLKQAPPTHIEAAYFKQAMRSRKQLLRAIDKSVSEGRCVGMVHGMVGRSEIHCLPIAKELSVQRYTQAAVLLKQLEEGINGNCFVEGDLRTYNQGGGSDEQVSMCAKGDRLVQEVGHAQLMEPAGDGVDSFPSYSLLRPRTTDSGRQTKNRTASGGGKGGRGAVGAVGAVGRLLRRAKKIGRGQGGGKSIHSLDLESEQQLRCIDRLYHETSAAGAVVRDCDTSAVLRRVYALQVLYCTSLEINALEILQALASTLQVQRVGTVLHELRMLRTMVESNRQAAVRGGTEQGQASINSFGLDHIRKHIHQLQGRGRAGRGGGGIRGGVLHDTSTEGAAVGMMGPESADNALSADSTLSAGGSAMLGGGVLDGMSTVSALSSIDGPASRGASHAIERSALSLLDLDGATESAWSMS
jgi:hypothetical protein